MTKKLGKYEIIKEIGKGAMGVVYLAFDPVIERQVAIKTMNDESFSDSEQRARFLREAKSAGGLQHPNIVTIYDMGEEEGTPYIVMEFVEGDDLDELIAQGILKLEDKLNIMIQLCDALSFAHSQGIIHRDIKPSNIRVLKDKQIKVMDFGIAKKQDSDLTRTGLVVGTISYMSPEQIQGKPISSASDQFSAGTVFYQLMTGKKPFEGENITSVIFKIISLKPEALDMSGVEPFVANIIRKMMANDATHRFPDCSDVAQVLKSELISLGTGKNNIKTEVMNKVNAEKLPPLPIDKTVKLDRQKPPVQTGKKSDNRKKSLSVVIILLFVLLALGVIGIGGFFAFKKIKRFVRNNANKENKLVSNNVQDKAIEEEKPAKLDGNNKLLESNVNDNLLNNVNRNNTITNITDNNSGTTLEDNQDTNAMQPKTASSKPVAGQVAKKEQLQKTENTELSNKPIVDKPVAKRNKIVKNAINLPKRQKEVFVKKGGEKVTVRSFQAFAEFQPLIKRSKRQAMGMQGPQRRAKSNQLFNKGRTYLGNKAYKPAALNFYLSTVYDPTNSHAYANLIISLEKLKAYHEAEKVLRQASKHGVSVSDMMRNVMFKESYEKVISNR
jgi:serine/threonine protein kinase